MTEQISKNEKFVKAHLSLAFCICMAKDRHFIMHNPTPVTHNMIGKGITEIEAWRDAARNIRNNQKQQP